MNSESLSQQEGNGIWKIVNETARSIITEVDDHDAFFRRMKDTGVTFADNFNNFIPRLSNEHGYDTRIIFQEEKIDPALVGMSFLTRVRELLSDEQKLRNFGIADSTIARAKNEFTIRLLAHTQISNTSGDGYCTVGNPELAERYRDGDDHAKQFVFKCAKHVMQVMNNRFMEDIWQ